jgi:hypothetical protein
MLYNVSLHWEYSDILNVMRPFAGFLQSWACILLFNNMIFSIIEYE